MPFASLVTSVSADLTQLEKDLKEGLRKWEAYGRRVVEINREANNAAARRRGPGAGTGPLGDPILEAQRAGRVIELLLRQRQKEEKDAADEQIRQAQRAAKSADSLLRQRQREEKAAADQKIRDAQQAGRVMDSLLRQRQREEKAAEDAHLRAIEERTRAHYRFMSDQRRAYEAGQRRAEGYRTSETISDLRGKISGLGVRPVNVSSSNPQAVMKLAAQFTEANSAAARFSRTLQKIGENDLRRMNEGARNFVNLFTVAAGAALATTLTMMVKRGFELNTEWERYRLALSASLALTQDVVNAQGQVIRGPRSIATIGRESTKLFKEIRKEANETILDTNELVQVFSENVGNAARAGIGAREFLPIASNIGQLAKALGLPGGAGQASQEVRSLLEGSNLRNSTVAKLLGLTPQIIAQAKEAGTLAKVIMEPFRDAQPIIDQFATSAQALFSTLVSKGQDFLRMGFEKVFERARVALEKLRDRLTDAQIEEYAKRFADALDVGITRIETFVRGQDFQNFMGLWRFLAANAKTLVTIAGTFAALRGINMVGTGLAALGGGALAGTAAGGGLAAFGAGLAPTLGAGAVGYGIGAGAQAGLESLTGLTGANQQVAASQAALADQLRRRRLESRTSFGASHAGSIGSLLRRARTHAAGRTVTSENARGGAHNSVLYRNLGSSNAL